MGMDSHLPQSSPLSLSSKFQGPKSASVYPIPFQQHCQPHKRFEFGTQSNVLAYTHTHRYTHECANTFIHVYTYAHVHTCIRADTRAYVHIDIQTCGVHMHTPTYPHTYTDTQSPPVLIHGSPGHTASLTHIPGREALPVKSCLPPTGTLWVSCGLMDGTAQLKNCRMCLLWR